MNVASLELESERQRIQEVNECINRLNEELDSAATSWNFEGKDRYRYSTTTAYFSGVILTNLLVKKLTNSKE